jgi:hypothetical protein
MPPAMDTTPDLLGADDVAAPAPWSLMRRWASGAVLVYFALYTLPFPLSLVPLTGEGEAFHWLGRAIQYFGQGTEALTTWFGTEILKLDHFAQPAQRGSGDTLHNYVQAAAVGSLALVAGLLLALFLRRGSLCCAAGCLRLQLRYVLAMTMLGYGFHKVFPMQFGRMEGDMLYWSYGNASPMNMLWCFLAASPAYTVFSGAMEALSGLLLFWRRTTLLGALLGIAVLVNVAMLNLCYDVPVKLYSLHLLAMAAILVGPDVGRLWGVLVAHRDVAAPPLRRHLARWVRGCLLLGKLVIAGTITWQTFNSNWEHWQQLKDPAAVSAITGTWEVAEFAASPANLFAKPWDPAVPTSTAADPVIVPWRRVYVGSMFSTLALVDGSRRGIECRLDALSGKVTIGGRNNADGSAAAAAEFTCSETAWPIDADHQPDWLKNMPKTAFGEPLPASLRQLTLDGEFEGFDVHAVLRERPLSTFLIRGRGFHWIQEYPFNFNR